MVQMKLDYYFEQWVNFHPFEVWVFLSTAFGHQSTDLIYSRPYLSIWLFQLLKESLFIYRNECIHMASTKVFHCFVLPFFYQRNAAVLVIIAASAHRCLIIQMKHETHHEQKYVLSVALLNIQMAKQSKF